VGEPERYVVTTIGGILIDERRREAGLSRPPTGTTLGIQTRSENPEADPPPELKEGSAMGKIS